MLICSSKSTSVLGRAADLHAVVVAIAVAGATAIAAAQTTDCNGDGIPDSDQFGSDYAVWKPGSNDGSGALSEAQSWCPVMFTSNDRLIFEQPTSVGTGTMAFTNTWSADTMWFLGGNYTMVGPTGKRFDLYGQQDANAALRVKGSLTWNCEGYVGGPTIVGGSGAGGTITVVDKLMFCYSDINIGTEGVGTVQVLGGLMTGRVIKVGASDDNYATSGLLNVGPLGTVTAFDRIQISDTATINGSASTSLVSGKPFSPQHPTLLQGSGKVGRVDASELAVTPSLGLGADGNVDAVLDVANDIWFADQLTGKSGVLQIRPFAAAGSGTIVPSVRAADATLGGLLRVIFDSPTLFDIQDAPIIAAETPNVGAFAAMQAIGLPATYAVRMTQGTDGLSRRMSVVPVPPPPIFQSGQRAALLRVATDAMLADFDGDGDLDAAIALAMNPEGNSRVRFFETLADGSQLDAGGVDVPGEARMMTAVQFAPDTLPNVAVAMGSADKVAIVRNLGGWRFTLSEVALLAESSPTGIAAGGFINAPGGSLNEIAVGCPGSRRVYIIGETASGSLGILATFDNLGGDIVRSGNLDGFGVDDLAVIDDSAGMLVAVTNTNDQTGVPTRQLRPLPASASAMCLAAFGDSTSLRQSVVVALEGENADGDNAAENLAIFRPGSQGLRPPGRLSVGDDLRSVTSGDFDGDGLIDLAVCNTVDGTEQLQFLLNRSSADDLAGPLVFNDGGLLTGLMRPRIVFGGNVDGVGKVEVLTIAAGAPGGSSLGPEMDEGLGSAGGGGGGGCDNGDANCDGIVNGLDITAVLSEWGTCTSTCTGDFNSDGLVDGLDMTTVLSNWTP